jgi:uncharacterized protein DUF3667
MRAEPSAYRMPSTVPSERDPAIAATKLEPGVRVEVAKQPGERCASCGTQLLGEYCHACGEKHLEPNWLSAPRFVRQFSNELTNLDFKSVRSLAALFNPGLLAVEFIAGRRRRYLNPLKLYFLAAAVFFLVAPHVAGFNLKESLRQDGEGTLRAMVEHRLAEKPMDFALFEERLNLRLQTVYTLLLGVSAVAVALILRLLYRRTAPSLGTHMVFALYYISFFYLAAIVVGALNQLLDRPNHLLLFAITYGILTPYVFFALKRIYRESAGRTLAKSLILLIAVFVSDIPLNIATPHLAIALT